MSSIHSNSSTNRSEWSEHLWDKQPEIDTLLNKSTDNLDKILKFLKEFSNVEHEYCKQASKLIDKYLRPYTGKQGTALEISQNLNSVEIAFKNILDNSKSIVNQHKNLANQIDDEIIKKTNTNEMKASHKKIVKDLKVKSKNLADKLKSVEGLEQNFKANCQKCVKAKEVHTLKDDDQNCSRADVAHAYGLYQRQRMEVDNLNMSYFLGGKKFFEKNGFSKIFSKILTHLPIAPS